MKRYIVLMLCAVLLFSLSGCKKTNEDVSEVYGDSDNAIESVENMSNEVGALYSPNDYGKDFKTVYAGEFGLSLNVPLNWDGEDNSGTGYGMWIYIDNIMVRVGMEGMYDVGSIESVGYVEYFSSKYDDIEEFVFMDGGHGYILKNEERLTFLRHDDSSTIYFNVWHSDHPEWYIENEELIYKVGSSLTYSYEVAKSFAIRNKYYDFMDSNLWAEDDIFSDAHYRNTDLIITEYKIFDLDSDGVDELWLKAYTDGIEWAASLSGFYKVADDKVVTLMFANFSGGSMGGDWLVTKYDTLTNRHVIGIEGYTSGYDGYYEYREYYEYRDGVLASVGAFAFENYDAIGDKVKTKYYVNGLEASKSDYDKMEDRFGEVRYSKYELKVPEYIY